MGNQPCTEFNDFLNIWWQSDCPKFTLKCSITNWHKVFPGRIVTQKPVRDVRLTFGQGGMILEYHRVKTYKDKDRKNLSKHKVKRGKRQSEFYMFDNETWNIPNNPKHKGKSPGLETLPVLATLRGFRLKEVNDIWFRFNRKDMQRQLNKWTKPEKIEEGVYPLPWNEAVFPRAKKEPTDQTSTQKHQTVYHLSSQE